MQQIEQVKQEQITTVESQYNIKIPPNAFCTYGGKKYVQINEDWAIILPADWIATTDRKLTSEAQWNGDARPLVAMSLLDYTEVKQFDYSDNSFVVSQVNDNLETERTLACISLGTDSPNLNIGSYRIYYDHQSESDDTEHFGLIIGTKRAVYMAQIYCTDAGLSQKARFNKCIDMLKTMKSVSDLSLEDLLNPTAQMQMEQLKFQTVDKQKTQVKASDTTSVGTSTKTQGQEFSPSPIDIANDKDFVIENDALTEYEESSTHDFIPEGVEEHEPRYTVVESIGERKTQAEYCLDRTHSKQSGHQRKTHKIRYYSTAVALLLTVAVMAFFVVKPKPTEVVSVVPTAQPTAAATSVPTIEATATPYAPTPKDIAEKLVDQGRIGEAAIHLGKLKDDPIARQWSFELWDSIVERETVTKTFEYCVSVKKDGTLIKEFTVNHPSKGVIRIDEELDWSDIISIQMSHGYSYTSDILSFIVGLKENGTVLAAGDNMYGQCDVDAWTDIVSVASTRALTIGLRMDGTVVATGLTEQVLSDLESWTDIIAVSASANTYGGSLHTTVLGLKTDGTVAAAGDNYFNQCDVSGWNNIVEIEATPYHSLGLKADGTVVCVGRQQSSRGNIDTWTDIVSLEAEEDFTVGLRKNGTVVAASPLNESDRHESAPATYTSGWEDVAAIQTTDSSTYGFKEDGTVLWTGHSTARVSKDSLMSVRSPMKDDKE